VKNTVSVIIPCYNAAEHLAECIRSVLAQTMPPVEIIVINDGSTDDSGDIAESFGDPVRTLHQENHGESCARNRGIDEARGEWIAFLDADDLWEPGSIEDRLGVCRESDVAVHSAYIEFFPDGTEILGGHSHLPPRARYSLKRICVEGCPCTASCLMVRRDLTARFPEWTRYGEDRFYFFDVLRAGPMAFTGRPLVRTRRGPHQQTYGPQTQIRRHRSMEEWLTRNPHGLSRAELGELRDAFLDRLIRSAKKADRTSDTETLNALREHLAAYPSHPGVAKFLSKPSP
jgi:glycosyltransferase involved in cell wall biosynthesis